MSNLKRKPDGTLSARNLRIYKRKMKKLEIEQNPNCRLEGCDNKRASDKKGYCTSCYYKVILIFESISSS